MAAIQNPQIQRYNDVLHWKNCTMPPASSMHNEVRFG